MNRLLSSYSFIDWLTGNGENLSTGAGLWSWLHFTLMFALVIYLVLCFFLAKKHSGFAVKYLAFISWFMLISRLLRMAIQFFILKQNFIEVLPWHICHILAFVFPIFYLTKCKKFWLPIMFFAFYGGILTFLFGNYYKFSVLSFMDIESIILHFMLPSIPIVSLASGQFKVDLKKVWQIPLFLVLLACYGEIGNTFAPGHNFMFIRENGLPFDIPGVHFILIYLVIFIICTAVALLPFIIYEAQKRKKENVTTKPKK